MHVLIVTSEWPAFPNDITGIHVANQVARLRAAGIDVSVFSFIGHKNPINYLKAILRFRRLDLEKYDVIHVHHGQAGLVALSQRKLPVVVTFHGSDVQGLFDKKGDLTWPGRLLRLVSSAVAKTASEVIVVSEHMVSYLPRRSYHVIPAGIDLELFSPSPLIEARSELGLSLDKYLVLFVGNPNRTEKRFWLAHESVQILRSRFDVELIVAQEIPNKKMPLYMNACDVLLITSSSEGSPTALKEALACNLPIVSTNVGDVRRRTEQIEGCFICENDRPEVIAHALEQVLIRDKRIDGREAVRELDENYLACKVISIYQMIKSRP